MRPFPLVCPALLLAFLALAPQARAQGYGTAGASSAGPRTYDFSGFGAYLGGSSPTYVPFGGVMGGFVPYSPGPGGGLGVASPMRDPASRMPTAGMAGSSMRPALGTPSGSLTPLAPITAGGMGGMGGRSSAGGMGGSGRSGPRRDGGRMGGMARPPVGGYPFRQPPSLFGSGPSGPSMSM